MNWCFIIPLIVGLICAILGYLLGRLRPQAKAAEPVDDTEAVKWRERYAVMEGELADCKRKLKAQMAQTAVTALPFDQDKVKAVFGKKIKQDDLKIVEGIGPKIEKLFHENGVRSWRELSITTVLRCREILASGGKSFEIHKPDTWPKQAEMADRGQWEELKQWQDTLNKGI